MAYATRYVSVPGSPQQKTEDARHAAHKSKDPGGKCGKTPSNYQTEYRRDQLSRVKTEFYHRNSRIYTARVEYFVFYAQFLVPFVINLIATIIPRKKDVYGGQWTTHDVGIRRWVFRPICQWAFVPADITLTRPYTLIRRLLLNTGGGGHLCNTTLLLNGLLRLSIVLCFMIIITVRVPVQIPRIKTKLYLFGE